ncbi:shikimate dehydrogenase family protein [Microbacterium sp.]|uniref:shikimate dehydrogenase family protein n=1 Tax=Microbacterium sp. TaxID=51671 RepID=UPI0028122FAF|nr:shikimate dehydrogenase [Microbacterium sp.]
MTRRRLAVWGDPIGHSRSPALHGAAYRALGLDWEYGRERVGTDAFPARLAGLDDSWRGLSLTMPLKEVAHAAADELDPHATLTGAVNTLLLGERLRGFNTDVGGIVDAFTEASVSGIRSARVLGAGATAASALVALHELGAERVEIRARRPEAAAGLVALGERLGVTTAVSPFDAPAGPVDATVATLPSGTVLPERHSAPLADAGGVLFEAAYAPWPSALAATWPHRTVLSGFEMLLHQAVRQIRIFLHGTQQERLPDEDVIVDVMRSAAMGD